MDQLAGIRTSFPLSIHIVTLVLGILTLIIFGLQHYSYKAIPKAALQIIPNNVAKYLLIDKKSGQIPISVNYHFTRKCNASCKFCFHTEKTTHLCTEEEIKRGLSALKRAGMRKINFAGGEPFLHPKLLGMMLRYCREELEMESISIVSNGSKIKEAFLHEHANHIDILAISCDSFDTETNVKIGRTDHGKDYGNVENMIRIAAWCKDLGIKFKMNSVICKLNCQEDMVENIKRVNPFRWKVFQVLIVPGENDSAQTKRNARELCISDEEFEQFCEKHKDLGCFVPESNTLMKSSYLILDEYMRFLDKDNATASQSILDVSVETALSQVKWDEDAFQERGGEYDWSRGNGSGNDGGCGTESNPDLDF